MITSPSIEGPLTGVLILDLSRVLAGPYATMQLADLGARVIKVERAGVGDDTRHWGPPFVGSGANSESTYFLSINRNKQSIALDFHDADDFAVLAELITRADVLVENFRPGVMERVGLSDERLATLNPRLIVLSISAFGPDGPDRDRAGYDQILQGEAGIMSLTGASPEAPQKVGVPVGDIMAGSHGALGVVAALYERERSGQGQRVSASLLASLVNMHTFQGTRWTVGGDEPQAQGNHHPTVSPYGAFRTIDGLVQIAVGNDAIWARFVEVVPALANDERFGSNAQRLAHTTELHTLIDETFCRRTTAEVIGDLRANGVPAGVVKSISEVYDDPQVRSQGLVLEVDHSTLGRVTLPGPALRFSRTQRRLHSAPPTLDEHGDAIRTCLADRFKHD